MHVASDEAEGVEARALRVEEMSALPRDERVVPPPPPPPPPAYGKTTSSVRADPELLYWHAVPSPVVDHGNGMPSPTYEEAMKGAMRANEGEGGGGKSGMGMS